MSEITANAIHQRRHRKRRKRELEELRELTAIQQAIITELELEVARLRKVIKRLRSRD